LQRQPFVLGIIIGSIEAQTMNKNWEPAYVSNEEVTNKDLKIKNFAVYMNFSEKREEIMYDCLTKDWIEDDLEKYKKFLK
jgi:hypothetical protein